MDVHPSFTLLLRPSKHSCSVFPCFCRTSDVVTDAIPCWLSISSHGNSISKFPYYSNLLEEKPSASAQGSTCSEISVTEKPLKQVGHLTSSGFEDSGELPVLANVLQERCEGMFEVLATWECLLELWSFIFLVVQLPMSCGSVSSFIVILADLDASGRSKAETNNTSSLLPIMKILSLSVLHSFIFLVVQLPMSCGNFSSFIFILPDLDTLGGSKS